MFIMAVLRTGRQRRRFARLASVAVFTLAHLFATIGFPVPSGFCKDHSIPFPCQDNPCGCRTAQECWLHCQCHTLEQRLAWAEARGIQPPEFVRKRLAHGWDTRKYRSSTVPQDCCSLCEQSQEQTAACQCSCSSRKASCCGDSPPSNQGWKWFAAIAELHCKGLSLWWTWTGSSLPPPKSIFPTADHPFRGFAESFEMKPYAHCDRPAVPPPR